MRFICSCTILLGTLHLINASHLWPDALPILSLSRKSNLIRRALHQLPLRKRSGVYQCVLGGRKGGNSTPNPSSSRTLSSSNKPSAGPSATSEISASSSLSPSVPASSSGTSSAGGKKWKQLWTASGSTFFDKGNWNYMSEPDPTGGQVQYVTEDVAKSAKLVRTQGDLAIIAVDNTSTLDAGSNRQSVRIYSTRNFTQNQMLVADIEHMPWGCSTWPAYWTYGPEPGWPKGGEIDILEGVNDRNYNQFTLHTLAGCELQKPMNASGTILYTTCDWTINDNNGCSVNDTAHDNSYGKPFNDNKGGVYVTLWNDDGISAYFFPRDKVPDDLTEGNPDPSQWDPLAFFSQETCDMKKYFTRQMIIINTTLCGQWAGGKDYPKTNCPGQCTDLVKDPRNYDEAYWAIRSITMYE